MATRAYATASMPYSRNSANYVPPVMSRTRRPAASTGYGTSSTLYNDRSTTTRPPSTTGNRYQSPGRGTTYEPASYMSHGRHAIGTTTVLSSGASIASHRPLPIGGIGPLDECGHKVDIHNIVARGRRTEVVSVARPVKANHSHLSESSHHRPALGSDVTSVTSKPPASLTKRTSSISNLTKDFDNVTLGSVPTTSLGRRGRTGSHSDLSGSTATSTRSDVDHYESESVQITLAKNYHNASPHSYSYNKDSESAVDHSVLPPVKKTLLTTRSPSQERLTDEARSITHRVLNNNCSASRSTIQQDRQSTRNTPEATTSNGIVGLKNLGNTCFMNSIVQCLSHTRLLREYCLSDEYRDDINHTTSSSKGALITAFSKVLRSLWKPGETYVSPTEFKSQIARVASRFVGYNQQDAQEFLIYLLEGLHEDVNRVTVKKKPIIVNEEGEEKISASEKATQTWKRYLDRDNSKIVDLFVGQLKSALRCTSCSYTSNTFDPFWDLSLPIRKKRGSEVTLSDCFELFTQEEFLDGDEKPTCARCKARRKCTKSFSIQRFPKILIIHLKRFNPESFIRAKLSTLVDFPLADLDLSRFAAERSQAPVLYNLYAVSNHSGTTFSGHYTAYCKAGRNNEWTHFSDMRVNQISSNHIRSSEAYVLFYELASSSHPARL